MLECRVGRNSICRVQSQHLGGKPKTSGYLRRLHRHIAVVQELRGHAGRAGGNVGVDRHAIPALPLTTADHLGVEIERRWRRRAYALAATPELPAISVEHLVHSVSAKDIGEGANDARPVSFPVGGCDTLQALRHQIDLAAQSLCE